MRIHCLISAVFAMAAVSVCAAQAPLGTAFTYQGRLLEGGLPYTGAINTVFRLFIVESGGAPLGSQTLNSVAVTDGVFTVELNAGGEFGPNAFNGDQRWLEIEINGIALLPRQPVNPTPYARHSNNADRLDGLDSNAFLQAVPIPLTLTGSAPELLRAENNSTNGVSVVGIATATSGNATGVTGETSSPNGIAVEGISFNSTGSDYGGFFISNGVSGRGVFARNNSLTGATYGIQADNLSSAGIGAYGHAAHTTGVNYGVRGKTESPNGYAGYFEGRGYFSGAVGVGTTSPTEAPFVVASNVGNTNAQFGTNGALYAVSNSPTLGFNAYYNGGWKYGVNGFAGMLGVSQVGGHLYYQTAPLGVAGAAATATTRFTILSTGEVGIGTSTPTAKLHIGGAAGVDGIKFPDGSVQVRAAKILRGNTGTLDLPVLSGQSGLLVNFGFPGATVGSAVSVSPSADYGPGLIIGQAFVPIANTVQFYVQNITSSSIDPPARSFAIAVFE